MGKWAWQYTTTGLDNSIELRTEKIYQAVTEIWVPQVWQPTARPDRDDNTPPARVKTALLWSIYIIEIRYRSLKTIHRSGVAVLHCPGCVWTLNPRCLESYTSTRLWLLPIAGVAKNLGSSDQLSSLAGGEACNWRCLTMNQTTVHETQLADMAPATPIHGNGLQLSPCGICSSKTPFIIFS